MSTFQRNALQLVVSLSLILINSWTSHAQTRRALLVGINIYRVEGTTSMETPVRFGLKNLKGPLNDVDALRAILIARYGFSPEHVLVLKDGQATREGMLQAFRSQLIEPSSPGDVALFFFAGHGSQVRNSKSPSQRDKKDETLVPADAIKGVHDIRQVELARLYNEVLDKGAALTVILDCCHSGSTARGLPSERIARFVNPEDVDVADPTVVAPLPHDRGALILAACQENQKADEMNFDGTTHGLLTHALLQSLRTNPIGEPAQRLFVSLKAIMQAQDPNQEPALSGTDARREQSFFSGTSTSLSGKLSIAVVGVKPSGEVELQGGSALGLAKNCELRRVGTLSSGSVRIRITAVEGLTHSTAKIIEGNPKDVNVGDVFEVDRIVASNESFVKLWLPDALDRANLRAVANDLGLLCSSSMIEWVSDPTEVTPTHIVFYESGQWKLAGSGQDVILLGPSPTSAFVEKILKSASGRSKLFLFLPPSIDVSEVLRNRFKEKESVVEVTSARADANYILVGRMDHDTLQYAWILPNTIDSGAASTSRLAIRSDWIADTESRFHPLVGELEDMALRIGRVKGWILLSTPREAPAWPYQLELKNVQTGDLKKSGTLVNGERYNLVLQSNGEVINPDKRFVYVFIIDRNGACSLLFPAKSAGNVGNHLPDIDTQKVIQITDREIVIGSPFGVDTYVLLTSVEGLPNPDVLESEGIRTRGEIQSKGLLTPLARLVSSINSSARGDGITYDPMNWSIEQLMFRSVPD